MRIYERPVSQQNPIVNNIQKCKLSRNATLTRHECRLKVAYLLWSYHYLSPSVENSHGIPFGRNTT